MTTIDGIPFECIKCGRCCKWKGYVFLSKPDVTSMANALTDEDENEFLDQYTRMLDKGKYLVLKDKPDSRECMFLENNECSIYKIRPEQCKIFPVSYTEECPGFMIKGDEPMDKMSEKVTGVQEKLSTDNFEKAVTNNLYEDLKTNLKAANVAARAIEGGVSMFFDQSRIKISSLDDLFAFSRVDDKHIVHKSTQDLWSIESDDSGEVHITRLFESGKPIKG
jgi:hypothetical protein